MTPGALALHERVRPPSMTRVIASLAELGFMAIMIDADTNGYAWSTTLRLAERFALTLYDAAYLELAQRRSLPLATLDRDLRAAALAVNVELLGTV